MKRNSFSHLHVHTDYSLPDGACDIESLTNAAVEHGMPAAAITDNGVLSGAVEFYFAAKRRGIKPIIGCEVSETDGGRFEQRPDADAGMSA